MLITEQNVHRTELSPQLILTPQQQVEPQWVPAAHDDPLCPCPTCTGRRAKVERLGLTAFLAEEDRRYRAFIGGFRR